MELFSLLAKLTLDTKEYEKQLNQAKSDAGNLDIPDPSIGLNTQEFDDAVKGIEDTDIDDPDNPAVGLTRTEFDDEVKDVEDTDIEDPDNPEVGLDTNEFDEGVKTVEEDAGIFSTSVTGIFKEIESVLVTAGIVKAVTTVIDTLKEGVELARTHGDTIDKQSQSMHISAKAYQEWSHAMNLSGASITDLNRGLRTWTTAVADDEAFAKIADDFEALGINADEARVQIQRAMADPEHYNLDSLLDRTMAALADYTEGDRGAIADALFGRGAMGLTALFNQTSEQIRDAKQEAEDLGMVMTDEEVKNAAAYNDAVTRLEGSIQGIKEAFVADLMPILTDATNRVAAIVAFFNPRKRENTLAEDMSEIDEEFSKDLASIMATSDAAEDMIDKLFSMGDATKLTAEQQAEWRATAEWLVNNIPSLSHVIDLDTLSITANKDEIHKTIEEWEALSRQRALATAKEAKLKEMIDANSEAIDKQAKARAAENDVTKKYYERIAIGNQLLEKYDKLKSSFEQVYGTTEISADDPRLEEMISFIKSATAFSLQDSTFNNKALTDAEAEYVKLQAEAERLQKDAEGYKTQLDEAQTDYESWLKAVDELYGVSADDADKATDQVERLRKELLLLPGNVRIQLQYEEHENGMRHAIGSAYIPYDDYPALLHRGEKVLTATEARQEGSTTEVDMLALEQRLEAAITRGMEKATVRTFIGEKEITDTVSQNIGNQLINRRYV